MSIEEFLAALTSRRRELNLTQREAAERVGVTQSNLCNWERHMGEPSMRRLWQWMDALDVTVTVVPIDQAEVLDA